MSRSCATGRSCQHLVRLRKVGDGGADAGGLRLRLTFVVVAGEKDARAVAELGAEQRRGDPEELLIPVIPDLRDGLSADAVHVLLPCWLLLGMLLRGGADHPGAMAGLCGQMWGVRPGGCHRRLHVAEEGGRSEEDVGARNCASWGDRDDLDALTAELTAPAPPDED